MGADTNPFLQNVYRDDRYKQRVVYKRVFCAKKNELRLFFLVFCLVEYGWC